MCHTTVFGPYVWSIKKTWRHTSACVPCVAVTHIPNNKHSDEHESHCQPYHGTTHDPVFLKFRERSDVIQGTTAKNVRSSWAHMDKNFFFVYFVGGLVCQYYYGKRVTYTIMWFFRAPCWYIGPTAMPRAAVTPIAPERSEGAIGCDNRPRHCRRDDIPVWGPNKITLLSLSPLDLTMYHRSISFLRAVQSRDEREFNPRYCL